MSLLQVGEFVSRVLNSKFVSDLVKLSEQAICRSETVARGWLIRKLRLDDYIRQNGWNILLASITKAQAEQLVEICKVNSESSAD
jgi:hypothetical protein